MSEELPIIRQATLEDLPVLLNFEQGLIATERPMDPTIQDGNIHYYDIGELIKGPDSAVFVAELNGEIVASGYARLKTDRHYLKHKLQGYLGFMFVPENFRGRGYNQMIVSTLMDWCRRKNVNEIRLDVYTVNEPAIRAYEKVGFRKHLINMRLNLNDLGNES